MLMTTRLFLYKSALTAALAGFLFGFDTVVISGAAQTIQSLWNLNSTLHGLAISMALWGTVLGAMTESFPAEKAGRRATLLAIGALYLISAAGSALAPSLIFGIFCMMMVLQLVWVKVMVPETKNISLEEMEKKIILPEDQ
jgi:MFS family permease